MKFIEDFFEGFLMALWFKGKGKDKPAGKGGGTGSAADKFNAAADEATRLEKAGQAIKDAYNYEEGFKERLAHPGKTLIQGGLRTVAAPIYPLLKGIEKGYPFWGAVANFGALPLLVSLGAHGYNVGDYNRTGGIDLDQLVRYGQIDSSIGAKPEDIPADLADAQTGIPWYQPYVSQANKDDAWRWVERVRPRTSNYAEYRNAISNLLAPGITLDTNRNTEGKYNLTHVYPDDRYKDKPKHIADAMKIADLARDLASLAQHGDAKTQYVVSQLNKGNTVSPKSRDMVYSTLIKLRDYNDLIDNMVDKALAIPIPKAVQTKPVNNRDNNASLDSDGLYNYDFLLR